MADVDTLTNLQKTYAGPHESPASLNTPFREALRSYATSQSLHFFVSSKYLFLTHTI